MVKKKSKKMKVIYEYAGDSKEGREALQRAYNILFDAVLKKHPDWLSRGKTDTARL